VIPASNVRAISTVVKTALFMTLLAIMGAENLKQNEFWTKRTPTDAIFLDLETTYKVATRVQMLRKNWTIYSNSYVFPC